MAAMPGSFLTNDLTKILKTEELASMALYNGALILGVFDVEDTEATMADGTTRILPQCIFTGRSEDMPDIAEGELVVIDDITYVIRFWMDDGTGMIDVYMERQS
jgi:hypothetical protein